MICYSPRHDLTLAEMTLTRFASVVDVWAEQVEDLGSTLPLGPGVREQGCGDGRVQPAPTRAGLGQRLPSNNRLSGDPSASRISLGHNRALLLDVLRRAKLRTGSRVVARATSTGCGRAVLGGVAVRVSLVPRRHVLRLPDLNERRTRLAGGDSQGRSQKIRYPVQRQLSLFDGLARRADGRVRPRRLAAPRALLSAAAPFRDRA